MIKIQKNLAERDSPSFQRGSSVEDTRNLRFPNMRLTNLRARGVRFTNPKYLERLGGTG